MKSLAGPDSQAIQSMFDRLARRYDLFNRLTSMGLDTFWRQEALRLARPGMTVLDLGCGTGDLAFGAARIAGQHGQVTAIDFSQPMLEIAKKRSLSMPKSLKQPRFILKGAKQLPIGDENFDLIVSGFVLRNIYENIDSILDGVLASLKNGGQISFLDLTQPERKFPRLLWKIYMGSIVQLYGRLLFGKDYPDFYLTESAKRFLKPAEFMHKLSQKGFSEVRVRYFMMGMVVLYQARKPEGSHV